MVLHPEIQEKAQQELDAVIGSNRLPDFSDRPALVYIEHIVQEVYRCAPFNQPLTRDLS
jgi:cytochrome P450